MVICRNCHTSLSDEAKFCGNCGNQPNELPMAPIAHGNVSYASPAYNAMPDMRSEEEGTLHSAGTISWWNDALPIDRSSRSIDGDHHQPLSAHPYHHQPSQVHGEHHQPQPMHGAHHQPQPMHGAHHQPPSMHAEHHEPRMRHARHPKRAENAFSRSSLIIATSSLIVVSIVTISLLVLYMTNGKSNPNTTSVRNITLTTSGKAIPGQTLQVIGNHFTPGQTVLVALDNKPLAQNGTTADTWHSSDADTRSWVGASATPTVASLVSLSYTASIGTPVTIQRDGTFTIAISIDIHWSIGSTHHLSVYNQQGTELKSLTLTIEGTQSMPTPITPGSTPTPTPTSSPTITSSTPLPTPTSIPGLTATPTPTPILGPVQRTLSSTQTQASTVKATGQGTIPGTQATGTIYIVNYDTINPLDLAAGTTLTNTSGCTAQGLQISLDSAVHLGPATTGVPTPGTFVSIHVAPVGIAGNIQDCPSVDGPRNAFNYYSITPNGITSYRAYDINSGFAGGTDPQSYTAVQQSDIDNAASLLKAATTKIAVTNINSQLHPNEHLVGNPQCSSNVTADHAAGDQATTVTVTVQTTCTATAST